MKHKHLDQAREYTAIMQDKIDAVNDALDKTEEMEEHASHVARNVILVGVGLLAIGVAVMIVKKKRHQDEDE